MAKKNKPANMQKKYLDNALSSRPHMDFGLSLKFHEFLTGFFMLFATIFFISIFSQFVEFSTQETYEFTSTIILYYTLQVARVLLFFWTYIALKNFSKAGLFLPTLSFVYWAILTGVGTLDLDRQLTMISISFSLVVSLIWIIPIIIYYAKRRDLFS